MTDEGAWLVPATAEDVQAAASHLITACEPEASQGRSTVLAKMLRTRDWTRAEYLLAMREVPFRNDYGKGFRLDVMADVIRESRELRALLTRKVTEAQMMDLCADPEVEPEHFACCGFDAHNHPLYIYAPESGPHKHAPKAEPEEDDEPRRDNAPMSADARELMFEHAPNLIPLDSGLVLRMADLMRAGAEAKEAAGHVGIRGKWEAVRYGEAAQREVDGREDYLNGATA